MNIDVLRDSFESCGEIICEIVNESLRSGVCPNEFKISTVIPIQKISGTRKAEEYRPINMISVIDKILQNVVKEQLENFLKTNNILIESQSGFRVGHSCESAINLVVLQWMKDLSDGKIIVIVFLDLKRAFETVDRPIMLHKLTSYGITGTVHA